jgi:hypothetical protein
MLGGTPINGNGGACLVQAANGVGTNRNGGPVDIIAGAPTGTGTPGVIRLRPNNVSTAGGISFSSATINNFIPLVQWDNVVLLPRLIQAILTTASGVGQLMEIGAQGASGANGVGGKLELRGGQVSGGGVATVAGELEAHGGDTTGSATTRTGGKGVYRGGDGQVGGNALFRGGTGAVTHGNMAFGLDPASYQAMQRGIFVANSTSSPTANPASGLFLYAVAGEPEWRTSGGTRIRWQAAAATASAGTGVLPLTPEEFLTITFNGAVRKIPLYLT